MVEASCQAGVSRCGRRHTGSRREAVLRFDLEMIPTPLVLAHVFEFIWDPGFPSNLVKDVNHSVGQFRWFLVEKEGILVLFWGESDDCSGGDVISVEGKTYWVVDGDDLTLTELSPVFNQSDVRGRFEGYRKITSIHLFASGRANIISTIRITQSNNSRNNNFLLKYLTEVPSRFLNCCFIVH